MCSCSYESLLHLGARGAYYYLIGTPAAAVISCWIPGRGEGGLWLVLFACRSRSALSTPPAHPLSYLNRCRSRMPHPTQTHTHTHIRREQASTTTLTYPVERRFVSVQGHHHHACPMPNAKRGRAIIIFAEKRFYDTFPIFLPNPEPSLFFFLASSVARCVVFSFVGADPHPLF